MAEKEYIDKVAFNYAIREAVKKYPNSFYNGLEVARQIAQDFPAADVRPAVRCRECKHWETDWTPQGVSDGRHYCAPLDLFPSADWYCSDGEKREES